MALASETSLMVQSLEDGSFTHTADGVFMGEVEDSAASYYCEGTDA